MITNISNDEIKQAIEDHWSLQLGSYFSSVHDLGGAIYNLGDTVTDYYWNYAGRIETNDEKLDELLGRVERFAEEHNRQPAFYIDPSTEPKSIETSLKARGFAREDEEIWMFYPKVRQLIAPQTAISGLNIRIVNSDQEFADFITVFHAAYEMLEGEQSSSPYGDSLIAARKHPPKNVVITHFVGYVEERPVSIASVYRTGRVAGLYNVGTPQLHRSKGYGAALSNSAIDAALRSGADKIILQTGLDSPAHRLYTRLGFTLGFTAVIWSKS